MTTWLKDAIIYQVYPISFYDSDGDGIGDLRGIVQKLPYIKDLGANTVWLNPIYKSPFKDGGYDISDYYSVDKRFGDIADFDALVAEAKRLGLRIIMDMVLGHTSDKHPWFLKSGEFERNEMLDRYIWTDNIFHKYRDISIHGLYERNGGYIINYYANQPALNFGFNSIREQGGAKGAYDGDDSFKMRYDDERLIPLREEVLNIMRFWLNRGIDGFRVDLANSLVKGCRPNSENDEELKGLIWLWNKLIPSLKKDFPEACFIAEWVYPKNSVGKCCFDLDFLTHDTPQWNMLVRNEKNTNLLPAFEQGDNYFSANGRGSIEQFVLMAEEFDNKLEGKGFYSVPTGSHDEIRVSEAKDPEVLKTLFAFLLTFKHVPTLYYGDEIGMTHLFNINKDGGYIRTGARTPMQWDEKVNKGFTKNAQPYIQMGNADTSVEKQAKEPDSLYHFVKKLITMRKKYPCLNASGGIEYIERGYPLTYFRSGGGIKMFVALNPGSEEKEIELPQIQKILLKYNCEISNNNVSLKAQSVFIALCRA